MNYQYKNGFWTKLAADINIFAAELGNYVFRNLHLSFIHFETGKSVFVTVLYRQRGKYVKRFIHSGMAGLTALGVMIAPVVAQEFPGRNIDPWEIPSPSAVLSTSTQDLETRIDYANKDLRDKTTEYVVQEGDTISTIAQKFNVSEDTVRWQNDLDARGTIKDWSETGNITCYWRFP
jgi:hypothetical protein